tara:strand:- start:44 stop:199 length:156 start_codon:yes stop_codon:yes gene_type:complete
MPMHKKKKGMAKGGTYGTPTRKMKMRGGGMGMTKRKKAMSKGGKVGAARRR